MNWEALKKELKEELTSPYFAVLVIILAGAAFLRFQYMFSQGMWVDEGRYARIGTEISYHMLDYAVSQEWHGTITEYPPLYSYLIAISTFIFGRTDLAVRIVSPVMGVLGVGLTYLLGWQVKNRETGLLAAALLAVNPIFWFLSERILIGATLTTFYTASILCLYYGMSERKYSQYALWALGPVVALSVMVKQPAYLLGPITVLYFLYRKRNEFKEVLFEKVAFKKTKLYDTLTYRHYYIGAGLGVLTLLPWTLRNMKVCGFPLCELLVATGFTARGGRNPAIVSVQDSLYFLTSMPAILTVPVTFLLVVRISQYVLELVEENEDLLVKYGAVMVAALGTTYFLSTGLLPMVLIVSMALLARSDGEKLLWLWAGLGIGVMSLPEVKVPRYVVFTIPALLIISSIGLYNLSAWLSKVFDQQQVTVTRVAAVLLLPLLFFSYAAGLANVNSSGFTQIEPAGEWLDRNAPGDTNIAASSPAPLRYFVHPRMAYPIPKTNESDLPGLIREKNIEYVEVDVYERTQARWAQTGIPPYRIPNEMYQPINSGKISPQQVTQMYGQPPPYLVPVKQFGRTRVPLTNNRQQPAVIIYRVNRSALP